MNPEIISPKDKPSATKHLYEWSVQTHQSTWLNAVTFSLATPTTQSVDCADCCGSPAAALEGRRVPTASVGTVHLKPTNHQITPSHTPRPTPRGLLHGP
mmetsp:Transcript_139393/g.242397  ORF Transcript_139393/g.242397 Transcript_139393/m.242397 type:complete len:99 (+) Transcript_139393:384-680(+)